jgi:hypothetical protein
LSFLVAKIGCSIAMEVDMTTHVVCASTARAKHASRLTRPTSHSSSTRWAGPSSMLTMAPSNRPSRSTAPSCRSANISGVGTEGIPLFKQVEQIDGVGIAQQIVRGYTFLSRNYEPGDEIASLALVAERLLRAASPVSWLDRAFEIRGTTIPKTRTPPTCAALPPGTNIALGNHGLPETRTSQIFSLSWERRFPRSMRTPQRA